MKQTCAASILLITVLLPMEMQADGLFEPGILPGSAPVNEVVAEILPASEAFRFGSYEESGSIRVFWQVHPGHYLYRDKFRFEQSGKELMVDLPRGQLRQDEIFGEVEVLTGLVEVSIPAVMPIQIYYQGCAERGYCYPPEKKLLSSAK